MSSSSAASSTLESLRYDPSKPSLQVLDQLLIPQVAYVDIPDLQAAWTAIRTMQIRGAPLIAIVAVLGLAVDLQSDRSKEEMDSIEEMNAPDSGPAILAYLTGKMDYLATSRPTAVNLFNALKELKAQLLKATGRAAMVQTVVTHAQFMLDRDVADNKAIGRTGADEILKSPDDKAVLMTICNTGSLATAGYGTALGVVRAVQERGQLQACVALETRPYNQGSRLTAFEMVHEQMPNATLICDSMAGAYMQTKHVTAAVVGADRVCANGDTANKIGTYNLSLVAAAHGVPVYVAAPLTTLDATTQTGSDIVIEERPAAELLASAKAPEGVGVWNPAFDVTPAKYIAGIITERGMIPKQPDGTFDVTGFLAQHSGATAVAAKPEEDAATAATTESTSTLQVPPEYSEQSVDSLPAFLAQQAPNVMQVLGTTDPGDLDCKEVGDGNLNLVFIITNKKATEKIVICKQALPYVRCVGESWPLTLDRSYFEYKALTAEKKACPEFVPAIYYFSKPNGLMVMEYIPPPNIILRKGLVQGIRYPTMASDMGTFCGKTLFQTSGLALETSALREQVQFWSTNTEMCALTEQVVFTEPYKKAPNNRWTSPQLDADKAAIEADDVLKMAAQKYKTKFVTETQALIHADLHSGSVMCAPAPGQTFVIDPEFAFYGPMGFDTGAFVANLFLAHVAQEGLGNGEDYAEWILEQIEVFWNTVRRVIVELWSDPAQHVGFLCSRELMTEESLTQCQEGFLKYLLADTLGFAGMKMLRRIVGIAHVEDLETIKDNDIRAKCERRGLEIAKIFIKTASSFETIEAATKLARETK